METTSKEQGSAFMAEYLRRKNERLAAEKQARKDFDAYFGIGEEEEEEPYRCNEITDYL